MREPTRLNPTSSQKSWLDRQWRWIKSMRLLPGRGYRLTQTSEGVRLDIDARGGGGSLPDIRVCRNGTQVLLSEIEATTAPPE